MANNTNNTPTLMRRNVWELGDPWAEPILWYARGVKGMQSRDLSKPTSWNFYGAIHGIDPPLWRALGYLTNSTPTPTQANINRFLQQCQHGSWYFLPWHRGYLLAFEANIRAEVIAAGGPSDWALPYWNYFKPNQFKLPPAFASPDWPDGQGDNPLFVKQRYGPQNNGNVFVPISMVNLQAMGDPDFTGVASGGSPGFGGVDTGFSHGGRTHGAIETQPHDWVHGLVGGRDLSTGLPGLMSDPDTAGLDPIFWLHHANIDRLWQVWRQNPPSHLDPTETNWLKGPANVGQRIFSMPMPDGSAWDYTPTDMTDLAKLGYNYDDLSPIAPPVQPADRAIRLGAAPALAARAMARTAGDVPSDKNVEKVGANRTSLSIVGAAPRSTSVELDTPARDKVTSSIARMAADPAAAPEPDRVFLNLENVRGLSDATALQVYVGVPEGASPTDYPNRLAGSIALFGVRKATMPEGEHAGQGLNFVLEITPIIDALHLDHALDANSLNVQIVPVSPVPEAAQVSIGQVSVFRQGA